MRNVILSLCLIFFCCNLHSFQLYNVSSCYSDTCEVGKKNSSVWNRVISGKKDECAAMFVGYSNTTTRYGDEGSEIFFDTPGYSRTVFLNGGQSSLREIFTKYNDLTDEVDQEKYNHLYGDFRYLDLHFPYMLESKIFDYIFVGHDTFIYFNKSDIVLNFCNCLKEKGKLFIAVNTCSARVYSGVHFEDYISDEEYNITTYFCDESNKGSKWKNFCTDKSIGCLSDCVKDVCKNINFSIEFFQQNNIFRGLIVEIQKI